MASENLKAMYKAVNGNNVDQVISLINEDPQLIFTIIMSQTFLHVAAQKNSHDVMKVLIENGLDVNATKVERLETALDVACSFKAVECVKLLLENGANVDGGNKSCTALTSAIISGNLEIVKMLLEYGADTNVIFNNYNKPMNLMEVAETRGHTEIIDCLKDYSLIDTDKLDLNHYRKERLLKRTGFSSLKELLLKDLESPFSYENLDDKVWMILGEYFTEPQDLMKYPDEFTIYFASRYLEWEVGNGGFAQAAYNIPEWFTLALKGYKYFNKTNSVKLIEKAIELLTPEQEELKKKSLIPSNSIEEVFSHFKESQMAALDKEISDEDWWIDEMRIEFVRDHRGVFQNIDEYEA